MSAGRSAEAVAASGIVLVDLLQQRHVQYDIVAGIGEVGWQLATATAIAALGHRTQVGWRHGEVGMGGRVQFDPPIERGQVLLVAEAPLPDEILAQTVYAIRGLHATIAHLAILEGGPPNGTPNSLGLHVHMPSAVV